MEKKLHMKLFVPILWFVKMNFLFGWGGGGRTSTTETSFKSVPTNLNKMRSICKIFSHENNKCNFYANSWWVLLYNKINKYESSSLKILCCPLRAATKNTAGRHSPFHLWALFAWLSRFLRGSGVSWLGGLVCVLIGGGSSWSGAWRRRRGAGL